MRLGKDEKGSVTIELGMFIVLICSLIFGYMAMMNGVKTSIALQVAAREGAREYATTGDSAKGKTKATEELSAMHVGGATAAPSTEGDQKSMTLTKNYSYTIPLFGTYNTTLKGYCTFYKEPVYREGE
jgi:Flp pilus assembly protein TadG